jgi:hypothetical protein
MVLITEAMNATTITGRELQTKAGTELHQPERILKPMDIPFLIKWDYLANWLTWTQEGFKTANAIKRLKNIYIYGNRKNYRNRLRRLQIGNV